MYFLLHKQRSLWKVVCLLRRLLQIHFHFRRYNYRVIYISPIASWLVYLSSVMVLSHIFCVTIQSTFALSFQSFNSTQNQIYVGKIPLLENKSSGLSGHSCGPCFQGICFKKPRKQLVGTALEPKRWLQRVITKAKHASKWSHNCLFSLFATFLLCAWTSTHCHAAQFSKI